MRDRCMIATMLLVSSYHFTFAQYSLGNSVFARMNRMQQRLDRLIANMRTNVNTNMESGKVQIDLDRQTLNRRIARQRQLLNENSVNQNVPVTNTQNVQITRTYRNGGRIFTTSNGGRGYVYNSPDGTVNIFSYDSGPQYSGSVYHSGPDGTYFRQW